MLDGFDLGVGILSLTSKDEERRGILMTSLSNIWDANETWLVLMAGGLFGAFPLAYGTILNALYIPILAMVFGFIFRAVAFEFRELANRKLFWNFAFGAGSFVAALGQGFALGAVLKGIAVDEMGHFIGTSWDWLSWQTVLAALTFSRPKRFLEGLPLGHSGGLYTIRQNARIICVLSNRVVDEFSC